jgi:hypothetical protein
MLKKRKLWNINEFNKINLPEVVSGSVNKLKFSKNNQIRVLDLPIHIPGQGWKIPDYLEQFKHVIDIVVEFEKSYDMTNYYTYITVDQKIVQKGNTGRRAGAHSDAYIERDNTQVDVVSENHDIIEKEKDEVSHTYVITDKFSTEFFKERFPLIKVDCNSSMRTFNEIAENAEVVTYPEYAILKLDPYVIHRSAIADITTFRTFVKISFSKKKYSRTGNTVNSEFDYNWKIKDRDDNTRNHPW